MMVIDIQGIAGNRLLQAHVRRQMDGVPVEYVVRFGEPAEEILREADAYGADLIAVTTGGRSGISRVALGSVAEAVFQKAGVAVLLFHPGRPGSD